jgi:uncharacterized protein (DUF1800 family)
MAKENKCLLQYLQICVLLVLTACGGTGANNPNTETGTGTSPEPVFTSTEAARFLTHATFGPRSAEISALRNASPSQWYRQQAALTPSLLSPVVAEFANRAPFRTLWRFSVTFGFWRNTITAQDQLRQRMAFALSELLVVSNSGGEVLRDVPDALAYFEDLLIANAFGNYRDILELVTYSPAMGYFLTYQGNLPADPNTGRMPDENYARELLQLFTIGVIELNTDGTPKLDANGQMVETYSNNDITGLAKVFTGLVLDGDISEDLAEQEFIAAQSFAYSRPMLTIANQHSTDEKTFLGMTIPAATNARQSIGAALDHIFAHANVGPFVGRQIIQRLVSSHPSTHYVERVATAFNQGSYQLPDGSLTGTGRRGDLAATVAAVLFDDEALNLGNDRMGRVREPILRFTHWARAFNVKNVTAEYVTDLYDTSEVTVLGQHPYGAPSVFNFFRPGYKAPGSVTGAQGLTAPELQITNASSIPSYVNFMEFFVTGKQAFTDIDDLQREFDDRQIDLGANQALDSFLPDYSIELNLADSPAALLDHLDLLLTYGTLSTPTRESIIDTLTLIPIATDEERRLRVHTAILMLMTAPDYLVSQ